MSLGLALCLVLFLPLIIAVVFALITDPNAVNVGTLRIVEVTSPGGKTIAFDDEAILDLYSSVTEGGKKVEADFRDFSKEKPYTISFKEENSDPIVYKLYVSTEAADCVCVSPDGNYYIVPKSVAEELIKRDEFASIDTARLHPELFISALGKDIAVQPDSYTWTYTALDGTMPTVKDSTKAKNPVIKFDSSDEGKIQLVFDKQPDSLELEIKNGDDVLFTGKYETLSGATTLTFDHDQKLSMKAVAEWYEIEGAEQFGKAEYNLDLLYDVAPESRIVNKTLPTGEFTFINIENFNDGEYVTVETELHIPEKLIPYDYKDIKLIPVPLTSDLEEKEYTIKLTTELGQSSTVKINVTEKEYDSQMLIIDESSDPGLNEAFTQSSLDEFYELVDTLTAKSANEQLYTGTTFAYPTGATKTVTGGAKYGMEREVLSKNSDGIKYTSFGQDMECVKDQSIKAANNGKVIFAEETVLLGNTVVVDHGYGILSYYGNLASISVKVGDSVVKSETILGKAGSTGFACVLSGASAKTSVLCHYAVSFNGQFIAPKSIYSGIRLS